VRTIVRGRTVMHDGEFVGSPGWGKSVRPISPKQQNFALDVDDQHKTRRARAQ
jgi:hypothetical protein